ncbi:Asp23/Gls24 family envelope stress response protein [Micromonospora yasonensis]|uniref:Asp23/Gls24 family envelope stress response protein n=1 Tax=Micromonospora yasonensis TaxID=1128667 RepID=UPI002232BE53|nr:Asp23/Gls24 family envelope stress response protein [Micromonospora yasonensis]MCW3841575.1 Asp23/Gls24 family envelope stress response protein [Micromonospora yasonensis]
MTGTLPRPGASASQRAATRPGGAATPGTAAPPGATAPPGSAPSPGRRAEEEIRRLAEDAARRTPAVSAPTATVRIEARAARVDLDVVVDHGVHLPTAAEGVRRRITAGVAAQTGLTVEAITVTVVGLRLPGKPADDVRGRRPAGG